MVTKDNLKNPETATLVCLWWFAYFFFLHICIPQACSFPAALLMMYESKFLDIDFAIESD